MKLLSRKSLDQARKFIHNYTRPLERARLDYHTNQAGSEAVITELERFQNPDGGFGNALEPDLRTPSSSALATGIGLEILKGIGCSVDHKLVRRSVGFLLKTFNTGEDVWCVAPLDANEYAHAPWWHDENGSLAKTFDNFLIIPRGQIIGLLWHYASLVPGEWLNALTDRTVSEIENIDVLGTGGGDDLRYTLSLAETSALPERYKNRLNARVWVAVPRAVNRDPDAWSGYSIRPLKVIKSPSSPMAELLKDEVQANLDYLIEEQSPDGSWDPVWTWAGSYPQDWERARLEWRGILTYEALLTLQAFGRIENP